MRRACIAAAVGPGMGYVAGRVWSGVPRLQPGGGGSRLRSLVRALVAWLGVGFSRRTLDSISRFVRLWPPLLSLRNTLTLRRSCLHSQHRIEVPSLVPRCLSPVPIRTAPASHCPIGHTHTCARTLTRTQCGSGQCTSAGSRASTRNEQSFRSAGNRISTAGACVLFESLTVGLMPHPLAL